MPEEQFGMILGRGLLGAEQEQERERKDRVLERERWEAMVVEEEEEEEAAVGGGGKAGRCSSWQDGRSNAVRLGVGDTFVAKLKQTFGCEFAMERVCLVYTLHFSRFSKMGERKQARERWEGEWGRRLFLLLEISAFRVKLSS